LVAFVGVGQVASAFVGDRFFAVLGAGLLAARHLQAAHGVVEKLDGAIDDRRCGRPAQGGELQPAARMGGVFLPTG